MELFKFLLGSLTSESKHDLLTQKNILGTAPIAEISANDCAVVAGAPQIRNDPDVQ